MNRIFVGFLFLALQLFGCVPQHLEKYMKEPSDSDFSKRFDEAVPASAENPGSKLTESKPLGERPAIYAIDERTFRFAKSKEEVWNGLIANLLRNYSLTIVNETSGVISTDWDAFYYGKELLRNKLTFHVRSISRNLSEVTIHNNVETQHVSQSAITGVWVPTADRIGEVNRVVQNLAVYLDLEPPKAMAGSANSGMTDKSARKATGYVNY